jgi:hypothetical protein
VHGLCHLRLVHPMCPPLPQDRLSHSAHDSTMRSLRHRSGLGPCLSGRLEMKRGKQHNVNINVRKVPSAENSSAEREGTNKKKKKKAQAWHSHSFSLTNFNLLATPFPFPSQALKSNLLALVLMPVTPLFASAPLFAFISCGTSIPAG